MKLKRNRTSFILGNRNGHHNKEVETWKQKICMANLVRLLSSDHIHLPICLNKFWSLIVFSFLLPSVHMKRKLKQWWWQIPPISTKRIITSHSNWTHWTRKKKTTTHDVGNPGPGLGHAQKYGGVCLLFLSHV
jgi:hypothetical protein